MVQGRQVAEKRERARPLEGQTYTLFGDSIGTEQYYLAIRGLADRLLREHPGEKRLLSLVRRAGERKLLGKVRGTAEERAVVSSVRRALRKPLSVHTRRVSHHLRGLSIKKRFDDTLATREYQYHLYMLEIELVNRVYGERFRKSEYKFALLPHCLRDFRPGCRATPGDVEEVCGGCTEECYINMGSLLLRKYGIRPYISVEMDQKRLFSGLKARHPSIGALGVACVPELANGMRLCIDLGIPPVGIPLDANRCARWMHEARESSFSLEELERLLR